MEVKVRASHLFSAMAVIQLTEENKQLRDLLEEVRQLLDDIYAEDIVSSDDLGKVYKKIERELEA